MLTIGDEIYVIDEFDQEHYGEVCYIDPHNDDVICMFNDNEYSGNMYGIKVCKQSDIVVTHKYESDSDDDLYYSSDEYTDSDSDDDSDSGICTDEKLALEYYGICSKRMYLMKELKQYFKDRYNLD